MSKFLIPLALLSGGIWLVTASGEKMPERELSHHVPLLLAQAASAL
jgi:hypothetical protein